MSDAQTSQNATASSSSKPKPKPSGEEAAAFRQSRRLAAMEEARALAADKAATANAAAESWEEQGKKKRAREDSSSSSDGSGDEYVEEKKGKEKKARPEKKRKSSSPSSEESGDELVDPEEQAAAANDPDYDYDLNRAESADVKKYFWQYQAAKMYWKPQVVFDYWRQQLKPVKSGKISVKTGQVKLKASAHMESAMRIFFSTTGKVFHGKHRCKGCLNLPLRSKRKISDGVPGIILKCKQISPTGRCAQCALIGEKCSLEVQNGDLVRVRGDLKEEVPTGVAEELVNVLHMIQGKAKKSTILRITRATIDRLAGLAEDLVEGLEKVEGGLMGLPLKYNDSDLVTVIENGEEVDFDQFF